MKICQYIPHGAIPDIRGFAPAIVAQMFYTYLKQDIEHYFVSSLEEYTQKEAQTEFGKVFRIGEGKVYRRLFRKITKLDPYPLYKRLAKIINRHPIDILHIHQLEFPITKFKKLLHNQHIQIIIHAHVLSNKFNPKNGVADYYIAVSEFTKRTMIHQNNYPNTAIKVVGNGVDTTLFKPTHNKNTIKDSFKIPLDFIVISFIGRKHIGKGFDVFLKTAKQILKKYYNIVFLSIGQEPNKNEKSIIKAKKELVNNYIDLPPLPYKDLHKIYQISDITLLPTKSEAQGMTVIESIATGCITISSKLDGIVETITNNHNGILIQNPLDINEILQKVEYAIQNLDTLDDMRKQARNTAITKFDWNIQAQKLLHIYKELYAEN